MGRTSPWAADREPPADAATADQVNTTVNYDVEFLDGHDWQWCGLGVSDLARATRDAVEWTGAHPPVPELRRVVEVTRTYYVWGDHDRVAVAVKHRVVSEHTYAGSPDPWKD